MHILSLSIPSSSSLYFIFNHQDIETKNSNSKMLDGFEMFLQSNTEYLSSSSSMSSGEGGKNKNQNNQNQTKKKKKKNKSNKRRFSDDQIRSLEVIFESESKLEPAKKVQVAKELGLHPRQVSIWFQNRRARWKSKELQKEYSILHKNYTSLSSQFESLKKDKQSLLLQIQKLNDLLKRSELKKEEKTDLALVTDDHQVGFLCNDDDDYRTSSLKEDYFGLQSEDHKLSAIVDDSIASSNNLESLEFGSSYQWWDVWS